MAMCPLTSQPFNFNLLPVDSKLSPSRVEFIAKIVEDLNYISAVIHHLYIQLISKLVF